MCDSSPIQAVGDAVSSAVESVGNVVGDAVQSVGSGLAELDKGVNNTVGWPTLAAMAAAPFTGGASLSEMMAMDAAELAASGLGEAQIADIMAQSYGIDQFAATNIASMATGGSSAAQIAGTLAADYGANMTGLGDLSSTISSAAGAAKNTADLVKYAKTGADLIGGIGKVAGGVGALNMGRTVSPGAADPFSAYRPQFASQLQALMQDPNTITSTPGYQFNLAQGLQGLTAQQAAQGRLVSGGALLQGQQFGQNLAQQTYNDQVKTLMALSGAGQSPATGATGMQNIAASNLGSSYGGWQAIAGGLGQISNPLATLYSNYNNPSPNPTV